MLVPRLIALTLLLVALPPRLDGGAPDAYRPPAQVVGLGTMLVPTVHPTLPSEDRALWLVPEPGAKVPWSTALRAFVSGVKALGEGRAAEALPRFSTAGLDATLLGDYARYYRARTLSALDRHDEALAVIRDLRRRRPTGYLDEAARWREAEALERLQRFAEAQAVYRDLADGKNAQPDEVLARLARTAEHAGDRAAALAAWRRLFYEHPLSDLKGSAARALALAKDTPLNPASADLRMAASRRARALYDARRYADAREAFEALRGSLSGDDRDLADLRIAVCYAETRRHEVARDRLASLIERGVHEAEARYHHASVLRALGDTRTFVARSRELVEKFPESEWAEEALNSLGTYYTKQDDDALAIDVFRELYARFPTGAHAERAAWKVAWSSYRTGGWDEAIRTFEAAAAAFPRANTRPAWLYWAARAREQAGHRDVAAARYRLVATDYLNSYYGRLASSRLRSLGQPAAALVPIRPIAPVTNDRDAPATSSNDALIRLQLSLDLYDDAMHELEYLRRENGSSPALLATMAWIHNRTGELLKGTQTVKRAYPQYLAAGGEDLPLELLHVVFPAAHLDLIRKHATANGLDPYLVAALIAQESGYDAKARSAANAYGLMQILPSTGRQLARRLGIRRFRTSMLTDPDVNIRMGTSYLARLLDAFGGQVHLALASYNAGTRRTRSWAAERPGLERDVFIDDIPFPETQGYVKRVLGMTEDYRRLYGGNARASR